MDFSIKPVNIELLTQLGSETAIQSTTETSSFTKLLLEAEQAAKEPQTAQNGDRSNDDAKLLEACRQLEAVFLNMLLTQMRRTVPEGGLLEGGQAEEIFTSMLDQGLTEEAANSGGSQLAEFLYLQLKTAVGDGFGNGK